MTRAEEAAFEAKADKMLRGHQPLPDGRNFACWNTHYGTRERKAYRDNYDMAFPPQTRVARMLAEIDDNE